MQELKVTHKNAILAKCKDCMADYADGKIDCGNTWCSLYSFMPYHIRQPNLEWTKYHPRRVGKVLLRDVESRPGGNAEALERYRKKNARD